MACTRRVLHLLCDRNHTAHRINRKLNFGKQFTYSLSCIKPPNIPLKSKFSFTCILYAYSHVSPYTEKQWYIRAVCYLIWRQLTWTLYVYTLYTQPLLLTYHICSYLKTLHFLWWGLFSALNAVDLFRFSRIVKHLLLGCCVEHCW